MNRLTVCIIEWQMSSDSGRRHLIFLMYNFTKQILSFLFEICFLFDKN